MPPLLKTHYTTVELANLWSVGVWNIRRALDRMGVTVPRMGVYRIIPAELVPALRAALEERGILPREEVPA